uniref:adenosine deaminase n=1 Tax=Arcella intermedia TaxID=1963864 RepID=A0A6B2KYG9_9EUKA
MSIFKRLPKAELHCHLDGAVRIQTIIDLAREQGITLPTFDFQELQNMVTVTEKCTSLEEYLVGFDITLKVLQKSYAITRAIYEVVEDAVNDGIRYLEIRFSPILHTNDGLSLSGVMEAITEGQALAEYTFPIKVGIIVCGMRQLSADTTKDLAEIAWRYRHKGVCGFDLAGPEQGFSSKYHRKAFGIVRRNCLNCTLHSGEGAGWQSVQDSIQFCGAHRLGHGVRLSENPDLVKFVVDHSIAIEVCVTSNIHTKAVSSLDQHPIRSFFDQGVKVVICTDNPTVSGVTLSGEYALVQEKFNFSIEEMVRMIVYGFSVAFVEVTFKKRMRAQVLRECLHILHSEGYDISPILNNQDYYDFIGVDFSEFMAEDKIVLPLNRFRPEAEITRDLCRMLPKTDLHVTFDASMNFDFVYDELNTPERQKYLKEILRVNIGSKGDLINLIQMEKHTPESMLLVKRILKTVLQTKYQLERALEIIFENAVKDSVRYMEIAFRPNTHTREKLNAEEALLVILNHLKYLNDAYYYNTKPRPQTDPNRDSTTKVFGAIVVYVSSAADDPIGFLESAKLAVKYKKEGVCGFGVYGAEELDFPRPLTFFLSTFHYLKENNMNVSMIAGLRGVNSIISAISEGGARRISGAFSMHNYPRLLNYVANHSIPIEIGLSERLKDLTKEAESFIGNPIRLLLDSHVPVVICSFRSMTSPQDRAETLYQTIAQCKLNAAQTIELLGYGFRLNNQSYSFRHQLYSEFKKEAVSYFSEHGFVHTNKFLFYPQ